jgi:hypothetical protein
LTRGEIVNACLTAAIFIATASSAVIFYFQWQEMKGASSQTAKIIDESREQVEATNNLAIAAGKQAAGIIDLAGQSKRLANASEAANSNAMRADRPWIGAVGVSAMPFEAGKAGRATITVFNSGRSPARIIRFRAGTNVFPKFPVDPPYVASHPPLNEISRTIVLPGLAIGNEFPFTEVTPEVFELIKQHGDFKFYIYGMVEYEDLRMKNTKYVTKICYFWTDRPGNLAFGACPEYNDAK